MSPIQILYTIQGESVEKRGFFKSPINYTCAASEIVTSDADTPDN
jgi:hypothetical protein